MIAGRMARFDGMRWDVTGDLVKGPGSVGIRLAPNHTPSPTHLDIDLVLDVDRPGDCVQCFGATTEQALRQGVDTWATVTASTAIELLTHQGRYADLRAGDADGFPDWHAIQGPIVGFGRGDVSVLQQWILANPLMPALAEPIRADLRRDHLMGVKVLFGGTAGDETCEVRVDGRVSEAAGARLSGLPWPRPARAAFARAFFLLVHREEK